MPYEYGSQSIDIKNPFRLEGIAYVVRAAPNPPDEALAANVQLDDLLIQAASPGSWGNSP